MYTAYAVYVCGNSYMIDSALSIKNKLMQAAIEIHFFDLLGRRTYITSHQMIRVPTWTITSTAAPTSRHIF